MAATAVEERDVNESLESVCARVDFSADGRAVLPGHIDDCERVTREVLAG